MLLRISDKDKIKCILLVFYSILEKNPAEICKIFLLLKIICYFTFFQITVLESSKRGGALIGGGGDKMRKYDMHIFHF